MLLLFLCWFWLVIVWSFVASADDIPLELLYFATMHHASYQVLEYVFFFMFELVLVQEK